MSSLFAEDFFAEENNEELIQKKYIATVSKYASHAIEKPLKVVPKVSFVDTPSDPADFGSIEDFRRIMFRHRLSGALTNMMYSMNDSSAEFMPHQFKPVIKFLESSTERLLVADEVGLGKTVEAMYIWKEVVARRGASKLLVVAPAMLTTKWKYDFQKFFNIHAEIVNASGLMEHINSVVNSAEKQSFVLITSLEGIRNGEGGKKTKRSQLNDLLEDVVVLQEQKIFDLVIIDEAHYLRNNSTASFKTGERLRDVADAFVLLSATPIQTSSTNLFNLLNLMSPEDFPDEETFASLLDENQNFVRLTNELDSTKGKLREARNILDEIKTSPLFEKDEQLKKLAENIKDIFASRDKRIEAVEMLRAKYFYTNYVTRSRKRDVYEKLHIREAHTCQFALTKFEKKIYDRVTKLLKANNTGEDSISIFSLIARQRQMASSLPAAFHAWQNVDSMQEILYEDFGLIDEAEGQKLGSWEVADVNITELCRIDSKYKTFKKTIRTILNYNPNEKIVVFSYFRATIEYLHKRLAEDGITSVFIMGGMGDEKNKTIDKFRDDPEINVLISSEVGSEGIDLQFSSVEINYDLPWNPMRLEQRIGRIDRIAQKAEKIRIYNMICENTIEDKILEHLYDRIEIFKTSIGDIEEILGDTIARLAKELLDPNLSDAQINEKAQRQINAIVKNKHASEALETQAGNLTAYRDYVLQSVENAHDNMRFITPEELMFTVRDFLNDRFPSSKTEAGPVPYTMYLNLSNTAREKFKEYIRDNKINTGSNNVMRLNSFQSDMLCCFDKNQKMPSGSVYEIIDVTHPLIKWMANTIDMRTLCTKRFSCLSVNSKDAEMPEGFYTYSIQIWKSEGVRVKNELKFFMCKVPGRAVTSATSKTRALLEENIAEKTMLAVLTKGATCRAADISPKQLEKIENGLQLVKDAAQSNYDEFAAKEIHDNQSLLMRQIYYTNHAAEAKLQKARWQIAEMKARGQIESVLRMHRGRADKINAERNAKIAYLEKKLNIAPTATEIAAGIVWIGDSPSP